MDIKERTIAKEELRQVRRRRIRRGRNHVNNKISRIRDPPTTFQNHGVPITRNLNPILEKSGRGSMRPTIYRSGQSSENVLASRPCSFSIPPSRMLDFVPNPFAARGAGSPAHCPTHPADPPVHYAIHPAGLPAHYATHPTVRRNFQVPDVTENAVLQDRLPHYPISTNQLSGSNVGRTVPGSQPDGRPNISNRFATGTAAGSSAAENFPLFSPVIPQFHYDPQRFDPRLLTIRQACSIMIFEMRNLSDLFIETLCSFSLRIYGLEDCPMRDLCQAVFFFIERYFNFIPSIEFCVRHIPDPADPNVVGVILERACMRTFILQQSNVLEGTNYRIRENTDTSWIVGITTADLN